MIPDKSVDNEPRMRGACDSSVPGVRKALAARRSVAAIRDLALMMVKLSSKALWPPLLPTWIRVTIPNKSVDN